MRTAAVTVSFSSRPGDLESKDDFFLMSSHLVSIETSLTIFNSTAIVIMDMYILTHPPRRDPVHGAQPGIGAHVDPLSGC